MKVRPLEGGLDSWRQLGFPMGGPGAPLGAPATGGLAEGKEGAEEV